MHFLFYELLVQIQSGLNRLETLSSNIFFWVNFRNFCAVKIILQNSLLFSPNGTYKIALLICWLVDNYLLQLWIQIKTRTPLCLKAIFTYKKRKCLIYPFWYLRALLFDLFESLQQRISKPNQQRHGVPHSPANKNHLKARDKISLHVSLRVIAILYINPSRVSMTLVGLCTRPLDSRNICTRPWWMSFPTSQYRNWSLAFCFHCWHLKTPATLCPGTMPEFSISRGKMIKIS